MNEQRPATWNRRKTAEGVTMGLSAVVVVGTAVYLLFQAIRPDPSFAPAEVRVLLDRTERRNGQYILPIEVVNHGERTLKDFKVQVSSDGPERRQQTGDFTIDYLGENATAKVYIYFDRHPRDLHVQAHPFKYQLE